MKEIIAQLIQTHRIVKGVLKIQYPTVYQEILASSPIENTTPNFIHESIFMYINNLTQRPKCLVCNVEPRRFKNIRFGYVPCCLACKGKSQWRKDKFQATCMGRFGASSPAGNSQIYDKIRSTMVSRGLFAHPENKKEYELYRDTVRRLTAKQPIHTLEHIEKRGHISVPGAYQLDHRFSIFEGFIRQVQPEIIAHVCNLQMLPGLENYSKHCKSSITLEDLLNEISKFQD